MKKPWFLILSSFCFAATVYAAVNLPKTGQLTSYATGDDGEIQTGLSWPTPRFADLGNGTVVDNLTGLMWTGDANLISNRDPGFDTDVTSGDGKVTFQHALNYVTKLNTEVYLGYSDWRLANRKEMLSLIDYGTFNPALPLYHPFSFVQNNAYWSSTTYTDTPSRGWSVDLYDGICWYTNKSGVGFVWPVRTGP